MTHVLNMILVMRAITTMRIVRVTVDADDTMNVLHVILTVLLFHIFDRGSHDRSSAVGSMDVNLRIMIPS